MSTFTVSPDGVATFFLTPDLPILEAGSRFCELVYADPETIQGTSLYSVLGNQAGEALQVALQETRPGFCVSVDCRFLPRSGAQVHLHLTALQTGVRSDDQVLCTVVASDRLELDRLDNELTDARRALEQTYASAMRATAKIVLDESCSLCSASEKFFSMLGYTRETFAALCGNNLESAILPEDRKLLHTLRRSASNCHVALDLHFGCSSGDALWVHVDCTLLEETRQKLPVCFCVFTEIRGRQYQEEALHREGSFLSLMAASVAGGTKITLLDSRGTFVYIDDELLRLLGYTYDELINVSNGGIYDFIYPPDLERVKRELRDCFMRGSYYETEYRLRKKNGSLLWIRDKGNRVLNEEADEVLVSLLIDIDTNRHLREQIEDASRAMQQLQNAVPGAFGKVALAEDGYFILSGNGLLYELLRAEGDRTRPVFCVYDERMRRFSEEATSQAVRFTLEAFFPDTGRWVMLSGTRTSEVFRGGCAVYYISLTDMTEARESARQVEFERQKYRILADISEEIAFDYDFDADLMILSGKNRLLFGNQTFLPAFRELLLKKESDNPGIYTTFDDFFRKTGSSESECSCEALLWTLKDGRRWFSLVGRCIRDERGHPCKVVGAMRDIDTRKHDRLQAQDKSLTDSLTGLYNKIAAEEKIRRALNDLRPGTLGVLMLIDIDEFYMVSDTLGQSVGNGVLTGLAHVLRKIFGTEDILGRIGGDEFQVFMQGSSDSRLAREKANALCLAAQEFLKSLALGQVPSVSVGLALAESPIPYRELYRQADTALYHAKAQGKNQFVFYGETVPSFLGKDSDIPPHAAQGIRNSLMVSLADMLLHTQNVYERLGEAFVFVGKVLHLSGITLHRYIPESGVFQVVQGWNLDRLTADPVTFAADTFLLPDQKPNALFVCPDCQALSPDQHNRLEDQTITSFMRSSVVWSGQVIGCITFEERTGPRNWTPQEQDILLLLSRLLGEKISNCQLSVPSVGRQADATRTVLNALPGAYVYVVTKETHEILYYNDRVAAFVPDGIEKMYCHSLFWHSDTPCPFCPIQALGEKSSVHVVLQNTPFGVLTDVSVAPILWEGHIPAYVILLSEHSLTEEERERKERQEWEERSLSLALQDSYTEIYRSNLGSDLMVPLFHTSNIIRKRQALSMDSDRQETMDVLVHPEDRALFNALYNRETLRQRFAAGEKEISGEYRKLLGDGSYHWVSASILPMALDNQEKNSVLILIKDISRRKKEEENQLLMEQYSLALRHIYEELFEFDLEHDVYRKIYHRTLITGSLAPDQGSFSETLTRIAQLKVHPDDKTRFLAFLGKENLAHLREDNCAHLLDEFRIRWGAEQFRWISLTIFSLNKPDKTTGQYICFVMDIDERKQAEEIARMYKDDERYRTVIEQTDTLVFEWSRETGIRYLSPELPRRFAGTYDERDLLRIWREDGVILKEDLPLLDRLEREYRQGLSHTEMTVRFRKRQGGASWCKVTLSTLRSDDRGGRRVIGTLNDVDDATRSINALKYRAEYDTLTGLSNMYTFYANAAEAIRQHPDRQYCIVRMDIDRFKVINDLYGLEEGDRLLIHIARLLDSLLAEDDIYARLGGDVFCLCVAYPESVLLSLLQRILNRLAEYPLAYKVHPSFGICRVESPATPINVMCDWANLALRTIKGSYLSHYAFYDQTLREKILDEKRIESEMNQALLEGQFQVYFQPKVDMQTSTIIGAEGLVRWQYPGARLITPDVFIPLFEKNGFILKLDEYVWEQCCRILRNRIDQGHTPLPLSVNVSRMHIHDPEFRTHLLALVEKYSIPRHLLELELTESAFLEAETALSDVMEALRGDGFHFLMDDFGSGYSSLNTLKSLPVSTIKIDKGFFNEVMTSDPGKTVIRYTIAMAREMNMKVIAEGVETVEQAAFLLQAGCLFAQGYLYSKPIPQKDFEALLCSAPPHFPIAPEIRALVAQQKTESSHYDERPVLMPPRE